MMEQKGAPSSQLTLWGKRGKHNRWWVIEKHSNDCFLTALATVQSGEKLGYEFYLFPHHLASNARAAINV